MCYLLIARKQMIQKTEAGPRDVLLKRFSANPQQIYSRALMQKCYVTFFETTFPYGSPPVNLLDICMTYF